MQLSHQRDSKGNRNERTYPKSDASNVEKWVISPRSALGRREKKRRAQADKEDDDDCAMNAHAPLEKRWGDIEL